MTRSQPSAHCTFSVFAKGIKEGSIAKGREYRAKGVLFIRRRKPKTPTKIEGILLERWFRHCLDGFEPAKCILSRVGDVKKSILVLVLLINAAHQGRSWRQDLVHEDEDGLLRRQLDALANYVYELANREICRDEILLLVDSRNIRFFDLLADDGDAVRIFLSDALSFSLALLEGMLVLKLGSHNDRFNGSACFGCVFRCDDGVGSK